MNIGDKVRVHRPDYTGEITRIYPDGIVNVRVDGKDAVRAVYPDTGDEITVLVPKLKVGKRYLGRELNEAPVGTMVRSIGGSIYVRILDVATNIKLWLVVQTSSKSGGLQTYVAYDLLHLPENDTATPPPYQVGDKVEYRFTGTVSEVTEHGDITIRDESGDDLTVNVTEENALRRLT